eukprot:m.150322 g.150322  ORF g.150322 m.150322 type:complete len:632 (+) comp16878_c1_seq2:111-2006(+)
MWRLAGLHARLLPQLPHVRTVATTASSASPSWIPRTAVLASASSSSVPALLAQGAAARTFSTASTAAAAAAARTTSTSTTSAARASTSTSTSTSAKPKAAAAKARTPTTTTTAEEAAKPARRRKPSVTATDAPAAATTTTTSKRAKKASKDEALSAAVDAAETGNKPAGRSRKSSTSSSDSGSAKTAAAAEAPVTRKRTKSSAAEESPTTAPQPASRKRSSSSLALSAPSATSDAKKVAGTTSAVKKASKAEKSASASAPGEAVTADKTAVAKKKKKDSAASSAQEQLPSEQVVVSGVTYSLPPPPPMSDMMRFCKVNKTERPPEYLGTLSRGRAVVLDHSLAEDIVSKMPDISGATVLDVSPGPGVMTRALLKRNPRKLIVVEEYLSNLNVLRALSAATNGIVSVHKGSLQKLDLEDGCPPSTELLKDTPVSPWDSDKSSVVLVGTPLMAQGHKFLFSWLYKIAGRDGPFRWARCPAYLVYPAYFAKKLYAPPGTPEYCRITILTQILCDVKVLGTFSRARFAPNLTGDKGNNYTMELLEITPKRETGLIDHHAVCLDYIIRRLTHTHREKVGSLLKLLGPGGEELVQKCNIRTDITSKQVTPEEYVSLANAFTQWGSRPKTATLGSDDE